MSSSASLDDRHHLPANPRWWRSAVVYQVYPRSFADGNGDGTGDIAGLRSRLGYLAELGVDAIWISPWYVSPLRDGGYDVADYRDIDPRFGTLDDAARLIADAHRHGIRVVLDLVPNHTSDQHAWFRAALDAGPDSREAGRYHFLRGRGDGGVLPPNDWPAAFGGPAWSPVEADGWESGWWYLHIFDRSQPDLNWEHPDVLDEFDSILRHWLDLGADGFRVDVAHGLCKAPGYPDLGERPQFTAGTLVPDHPFWDRDELHPIIRRWRRVIDEYDGRMLVAEASVHASRLPLFLRPDEYHQSFDFDLLATDWSAVRFGEAIERSLRHAAAVGAMPTWVLSNHDVVRPVTRYGLPPGTDHHRWIVAGPRSDLDEELGRRRARAAALVLLGLPGAAYLYQGEELGLGEVLDLPADVWDDPTWVNSGGDRAGRDGCRVPLPWTADGTSMGFAAVHAEPWLPQPESFRDLAASVQIGSEASTLELYRRALRIRRSLLRSDESVDVAVHGDVLRFDRRAADGSGFVGVLNFGDAPAELPQGEVLVASDTAVGAGLLPGSSGAWIRRAERTS